MKKKTEQKYNEAEEIKRQADIAKAAKAKAVMINSSTPSDDMLAKESIPSEVKAWRYWRKKKAEDEKFEAALVDKIKAFIKIINDAKENPKKFASKPKMRFDNKRAFLLDYLGQGRPPNFESVWLYIKKNAGKENFVFKSVSNQTATMTDGTPVEKSKYSRQFRSLLKKIKETENI